MLFKEKIMEKAKKAWEKGEAEALYAKNGWDEYKIVIKSAIEEEFIKKVPAVLVDDFFLIHVNCDIIYRGKNKEEFKRFEISAGFIPEQPLKFYFEGDFSLIKKFAEEIQAEFEIAINLSVEEYNCKVLRNGQHVGNIEFTMLLNK